MKKLVFTTALVTLAGGAAAAPASPQANEFKLPQFETTKLANGLTVMLMERHEVPHQPVEGAGHHLIEQGCLPAEMGGHSSRSRLKGTSDGLDCACAFGAGR